MAFDLLDSVKGLFTGDVAGQAAGQLGESESGIQKALTGIIPTVLTGLLHKAGSQGDAAGALNITREAAGANTPGNILGILQGSAGGWVSKGTDILRSLFGDKVSSIAATIAAYAGIKESSASSLLNAAAPASLGVVGQYASQNNLNPSSFLSFLNSQKDKILAAVPSGLNLAGLLGLGSLADLGKKLSGFASGAAGSVSDAARNLSGGATRAASGSRWIWSLLLILVAIILLWYLVKGCGGKTGTMTTTDSVSTGQATDTSAAAPVAATTEPARESIKVTLPDGTVLDAYKGGIEDQLVTFLKDGSRAAGKDVWFDFDNLNFKTGSAELTPESGQQVKNIAAILKAFPKAKIKIGGYTDRSGDSTINKKLSQSRADAVQAELKKLNADPKQLLGAEGYGSAFAKAAADAPDEERKKDRHISISVREK